MPSPKVFLNMFINSIESLASEMEWATHFFLNPQSKTAKNTFNFKSNAKPPKNKELVAFKKDLVDIAKNIEFEKRLIQITQNMKCVELET